MSFKFVNKSKTKYNPSVIEYSSSYQLFICGTYQLFEEQENQTIDDSLKDTLKRVNNRFGNLLLISETNELVEEFECFDGGVFDLKLIQWNGAEDCPLVAHSNGFVNIYSIDSSHKLQTIRRYETNSSLLTSLCQMSNQWTVVGDSDGKLVFIDLLDEKTTPTQLSITKFSEPIWTLFCSQINDKLLLFVGSDDSVWRLYGMSSLTPEVFKQLKAIHVNRDSSAGITSFASNCCSNNLLSLIVGSYDEFIRFYSIKLSVNGSEIKVCLQNKLHIPGSGIWRIIIRNSFKNTLLVSGMYSGAHIITDAKVSETLDPLNSNLEQKELIYGLNCDFEMNNILMASFYGQTLYLFTKS